MSTEDNKVIVRRLVDEVFNRGNSAAADEIFSPDLIEHVAFPGQPPSLEGVKQTFAALHAAFPDVYTIVDDIITENDKIVVRWTLRGTHKGQLMGIPPTGKQVTMTGVDIVRVAGGKIVEHWGNRDDLGVLRQLTTS